MVALLAVHPSYTSLTELIDKFIAVLKGTQAFGMYLQGTIKDETLLNKLKLVMQIPTEAVAPVEAVAPEEAPPAEEIIPEEVFGENTSLITHLIFGHTHKAEIFEKNGILIANTGAWQHVNPSFIELSNTGKFSFKSLNTNGKWESQDF